MRLPGRDRKGTGRGAVGIIAAMLLISALLRLVPGIGTALAEASETGDAAAAAAKDDTKITSDGRDRKDALLATLLDRERKLEENEQRMELRRKALAVADAEIEKRLQALAQAEENLRQTLALADGAAEKDLARLTAVYENMKSKDAAALFEAMDPGFAAGFLARMRPEAAAGIMAGLSPDAAYSISAILAGRNAGVPKT